MSGWVDERLCRGGHDVQGFRDVETTDTITQQAASARACPFQVGPYRVWRSQSEHSAGLKWSSRLPMRCQTAAMDRSSAFRSSVLSLANTIPIGFRSGLQGGRNSRCAPALRIARRTALPLWLPRLSRTTSPVRSVGARNCRTQARNLTPLIGPPIARGASLCPADDHRSAQVQKPDYRAARLTRRHQRHRTLPQIKKARPRRELLVSNPVSSLNHMSARAGILRFRASRTGSSSAMDQPVRHDCRRLASGKDRSAEDWNANAVCARGADRGKAPARCSSASRFQIAADKCKAGVPSCRPSRRSGITFMLIAWTSIRIRAWEGTGVWDRAGCRAGTPAPRSLESR